MTFSEHTPTLVEGKCIHCNRTPERHRPSHTPKSSPYCKCGALAINHRVTHVWRSGECCYASKSNHRTRIRDNRKSRKSRGGNKNKYQFEYIGIDGEGKGRNPHIYTTLCAASADGTYRDYIHNESGLNTEGCLEFILSIPAKKVFAYSFGYDLTKILADLPNDKLYRLLRPETRKVEGKKMPVGIKWNGYYLNLLQTRFTVCNDERSITIWDIWKFYQSKFTTALKNWKIDTHLASIGSMKDKRAEFDKLSHEEILGYCMLECESMAELAKRLVEAHQTAGIKLKAFYGAGSTASAILGPLGIADKRGEIPEAMQIPVRQAFFGGRFEHSLIGEVKGKVYGYDISSAYPYQLYHLPCLIHGKWTHTKARLDIEGARTALVRYSLVSSRNVLQSWAPFPYRSKDGTITFPKQSPGGWLWRDEFLSGERQWSGVRFHEAWVLESDCDCAPFSEIPRYYLERLRWGKEGPGIVLKLGINSVYGKLAQSIGNPRFASWIWAGMVTSGTRAQILDTFESVSDHSDIVAIATDGIYSMSRLSLRRPTDTGTFHARNSKGELCPLGGWEEKIAKKGMFFARPGIYWPLQPTEEELNELRARGIGRAILAKNHALIQDAWERKQTNCGYKNCQPCKDNQVHVAIQKVSRFRGAKTTIQKNQLGEYKRSDAYGEWQELTIALSLDPRPKRGPAREDGTLELLTHKGKQSAPYSKAMSPEALEAWLNRQQLEEQPDCEDWSEWED